jgi:hypothetical protein
MRIRGFLVMVLAIIALMAMAARPARAQSITCSSDNGKRNYCGVNTNGGVSMVRQRSGSACTQGYSWGYDRRGIWVDHGCRADFVVNSNAGNRPGRPGFGNGGPAYGQSITCSSDDGKRNYCAANTSGGVQMVRQRSGSPCQQGSTWGYDRRGIWVDRGCRADFVVNSNAGNRPGRPGFGNGGPGSGQSITCSSDNGKRNFCAVNSRGTVSMVRQRSDARCTQGYSWGYDRRGIWVDHGCRADFVVR